MLQLPLGIGLREEATFDSYYAGPNGEALAALEALAAGGEAGPVYLWGADGLGRSHLLQAACHRAGESGRQAAYLPLEQAAAWDISVLEGLEQLELVCLDDLQAVAGRAEWEEGLFDLFNRLREAGRGLAVAASARPAELPLGLADLGSRLSWGLTLQLQPLDDGEKGHALRELARRRGLELGPEAAEWLLRRCPRDMAALVELLGRLDRASLAAQRRLTVPFLREFMQGSGEAP